MAQKRQYFQPEALSGKVSYDGSLSVSIVDSVREGATLENGQVITKEVYLTLFSQKYSCIFD